MTSKQREKLILDIFSKIDEAEDLIPSQHYHVIEEMKSGILTIIVKTIKTTV